MVNIMLILVIYLLALLIFSFVKREKSLKEDDFYLAGRKVSSLRLTCSLLATIIGASSTIGLVGLTYQVGLPGSLWLIMGSIGLFVLALIYQRYSFPAKIFTLPEFLGGIYGKRVKKITSFIIVLTWTGIISAQILAMGKIFGIFLPSHSAAAVLFFSTFILVFYTAIGGQKTVIFTDFIQFILLLVGIGSVSCILLINSGSSFSSINPEYLRFPLNNYFSLSDLIYFLIVLGSVYLIGPDIHSRLFCASSVRTRKKALKISALLLIPVGFLISLIGVFSHYRFGTVMPDEVLPLLINEVISFRPLKYLFLLSLISALFSSADTCLLTSSVILIRDIFNLKGRRSVIFTRWGILFIGLLAYFLSIYFLIPFKEKLKITNEAVFLSIPIAGGIALISNIFKFRLGIYSSYILGAGVIFLASYLKRRNEV